MKEIKLSAFIAFTLLATGLTPIAMAENTFAETATTVSASKTNLEHAIANADSAINDADPSRVEGEIAYLESWIEDAKKIVSASNYDTVNAAYIDVLTDTLNEGASAIRHLSSDKVYHATAAAAPVQSRPTTTEAVAQAPAQATVATAPVTTTTPAAPVAPTVDTTSTNTTPADTTAVELPNTGANLSLGMIIFGTAGLATLLVSAVILTGRHQPAKQYAQPVKQYRSRSGRGRRA